jgi:formylmethanofuran dehydrogenase subunit C
VSETVTLTLRSPLSEPVDAEGLTADRIASLNEAELGALPVLVGRTEAPLGDLFTIRGGRSARVEVAGDVRHVAGLGAGMSGGELTIDGDVGSRVGAGMRGGRIEVLGSAGDDAGLAMAGGSLVIRGNAGDRLGAGTPGASRGMTGGEIVVAGAVGADAGARMRRGLLCAGGNAGERAARAIIAGTVIVLGRTGSEPAVGSKRGTLVAIGGVAVPVTYSYACTYEPPHVRLALVHVRRRYGMRIADEIVGGRYRRFTGDAGTIGKGEILEWVRA